jgi:hypothetical protein
MKNSVLKIISLGSIIFFFVSCNNSPKDKENELKNAQDNVVEAKYALEQAQIDSVSDYENFKAGIEIQLDENEKRIEKQKSILNNSKEAQKEENLKQLRILEEKNKSLKSRLRNFELGTAEKWELFKMELNDEMDKLGKSISAMAEN